MSGLVQYLFNYCAHGGQCTTKFEQFMYDWWPGYKAGTCLYNAANGGGCSGWELLDLGASAAGVAGKGLQLLGTAGRQIQLVDGYYQAEGSAFKFSQYYYDKLWATGRGAPFLQAQEVLQTATTVTPDRMAGFYRYANGAMEMVYNPQTKEVWHLMPTK